MLPITSPPARQCQRLGWKSCRRQAKMRAGGKRMADASLTPADPVLIEDLVAANRILSREGVVDGFGHVSVRHDTVPGVFLLARSMAPGLVTAADLMLFDFDGNAFGGDTRTPYVERFIH